MLYFMLTQQFGNITFCQNLDVANIERLTDGVKLARPLKVVVECGNGGAGFFANGCRAAGRYPSQSLALVVPSQMVRPVPPGGRIG